MFLILTRATVDTEAVFLMETDEPAEALASLQTMRANYPHAFLAEILIPGADPRTAIPGELDRAIDAWNDRIVGKLKFAKSGIRARGHYVDAYRKWKRELGRRPYLLAQVVGDVLEATDFTQSWIRFGLLFAKKNGEYHSDLFRAGHYRDPNRRAPEPEIVMSDEVKREWAAQLRAQGGLRDLDARHLRNLEAEGF